MAPDDKGLQSSLARYFPAPEKKEIRFGYVAREYLRRGIDLCANIVGSTLGPRGRNVAFKRYLRGPQITNDGVTVANELDKFKNIFLDLGIQLMKEAATATGGR